MLNFLVIAFITLCGLGLRLINLNKPEGLWNDEYISWFVASHPLGKDFLHEIFVQCHMPLYYLYLKFCMHFGGSEDLFLRSTSVVAGVFSIVVMYFVGKQNSNKAGILCALFAAISSFLIYYSQEVRLYSILFLFSALALLYLLKFLKNKTWTNLGGLVLCDFLILFTHTIGFVYVFFQLIALSILLFNEFKKQIIIIWSSLIVLGGLFIPQIISILTRQSFSQWWGSFSISKIGFLFTDYFSPVLTNLVNAPENFLYIKSFTFILFAIIPPIIAIVFIIKSLIKNRVNISLFGICIGVVAVLTGAAIMGKLVFITKYSIEIYPVLMYLAVVGACTCKHKKTAYVFVTIFCLINLAYIFISPTSAPKIPRLQGHKLVADMLNDAKPQDGDFIIMEYYPSTRFEKYFDFSKYKLMLIHKGNFHSYLSKDMSYIQIYTDGKEKLKATFASDNVGYFDYKIRDEILKNIKPGQNVFVVMADSVAFYSPEDMKYITGDAYIYEKTPLMYLIFSYIKNRVILDLSGSLAVTRFEQRGDWSLIRFTKLNK